MSYHPTIQGPLNELIASLVTAGASLAQAAVALFHLIFAFGHFWFDQFVQFAQTVIQLGFDLFRGVAGFVVGTSNSTVNIRGVRWSAYILIFGSQFLRIIHSWWRVLLVVYSIQKGQRQQSGQATGVNMYSICCTLLC
jgi:hypothetical protein